MTFILALVGTTPETHPELWERYMGDLSSWIPTSEEIQELDAWITDQSEADKDSAS
jgi:hypothetical protein